jgi:ribosomal protein S18 acetylase RimI-like enzyme
LKAPAVLRFRKSLGFEAPPQSVWPDGVALAEFDLQRDGLEARDLLNTAYAPGGGEILDFQAWAMRLRGDAEYDPELCFAVRDIASGRMAGFAQCWTSAFIKDIAVAADWRRQGLGHALMAHIFAVFRARGEIAVNLKVEADNPSGAVNFYQSLGMEQAGD